MESIIDTKFASKLLSQFNETRKDEKNCDVFLETDDGQRIGAHRTILAMCSEYFNRMFHSDFKESKSNVHLKCVDGNILRKIIDYYYTGNIEINRENIPTLFKMAHYLQFAILLDVCCDFWLKDLNSDNFWTIVKMAEYYSVPKMIKATHSFAIKNFSYIAINEQDLGMLSKNQMFSYMEDDNLYVKREEEVYDAFLRWITYDSENRMKFVPELLPLIRLNQLEPTFLTTYVRHLAVINNCADIVDVAIKWQNMPFNRHSLVPKFKTHPRRSTAEILFFAIGGKSFKRRITTVEYYSTKARQWTEMGDIEFIPGTAHCLYHKHEIIIAGGTRMNYVNSMFSVNLLTLSVRTLPPMREARNDLCIEVIDDSVYIIGGSDVNGPLQSVERLDLLSREWSNMASMHVKRIHHMSAVLNDCIYVVGGCNFEMEESFSTVECYNPQRNEWTMKASMNHTRAHSALVAANGFLYVFGGYDFAKVTSCHSVERYDPTADTWTLIGRINRSKLNACFVYDKIYLFGGVDNAGSRVKTVEVFDLERNTFRSMSSMRSVRANFCMGFYIRE